MKTEIIVDGIYFDEDGNAQYIPELEYTPAKNMTEAKRIAKRFLKTKPGCTHV